VSAVRAAEEGNAGDHIPTPSSSTTMRHRTQTPGNWPLDVRYIAVPHYHTSVPANIRSYLEGVSPSENRQKEDGVHVTIRRLCCRSHPAYGQYGLFAAKKIAARTRIVDYLGEVHGDERESDYDLSLYRTQNGDNIGIDARHHGNEARFINDFRGVRSRPNALFADGRTRCGELRISVWSGSEGIKKGEEILVSYGKSWWSAR
jgi:hypothetical protein